MDLQKGASHGNGQEFHTAKSAHLKESLHKGKRNREYVGFCIEFNILCIKYLERIKCYLSYFEVFLLALQSLLWKTVKIPQWLTIRNSRLECQLKWLIKIYRHFLQCSTCLRKHRKLCSLYSTNPPSSPRKIALPEPTGPVTRIYECVRADQWLGYVLPSNLTHRESGNR